MNLYSLFIFLHIVGAVGLFLGLGMEGTIYNFFKRADTTKQAMNLSGSLLLLRITFSVSTVLLLLSGIYMVIELWGWVPWVIIGLILVVILSGSGSMTGKKIAGVLMSLSKTDELLPADFTQKLSLPFLIKSFKIKILLVIGTIFIMTMKADWVISIVTIIAAFIIGLLISAISGKDIKAT